MDTNKNSYTIIYATLLVIVVAAVLAFVSMGLKSKQQTNIDVEKQLNMLGAAGLAQDAKNAPDKNVYVQEQFKKYFTAGLVVNAKGEITDSASTDLAKCKAFKISPAEQYEIMKKIAASGNSSEQEKLKSKLELPVFVCHSEKGETLYVFACYGPGLWGPIWGFISLQDDFRTVGGALYDHKSETPGLGAEITSAKFENQFKGKEIFTGNNFSSIKVVKGGAKDKEHDVDALSGATITSTSLQNMLAGWLNWYLPYIQKNKILKEAADKAKFNALVSITDSTGISMSDSLNIK